MNPAKRKSRYPQNDQGIKEKTTDSTSTTPLLQNIDINILAAEISKNDNIQAIVDLLNKKKAETTSTSTSPDFDIDSLADKIAERLPTNTYNQNDNIQAIIDLLNKQKYSTEETSTCTEHTKPTCTNNLRNKIEGSIIKHEGLSELYHEFQCVESIINNIIELVDIKKNKQTQLFRLAEESSSELEAQLAENARDDIRAEVKKISKLKRNDLFTSSHNNVKADLTKELDVLSLSNTQVEEYTDICTQEICFEESALIKYFCGALLYGELLPVIH